MRAKKPKKPSRAIQYMLSADRKLRKLSLKKVQDSGTKTRRTRKSNATPPASSARARSERRPAKPAVDVRPQVRALPEINSSAVAFAIVGVVAIATLLIARPGSEARDMRTPEARIEAPPTPAIAPAESTPAAPAKPAATVVSVPTTKPPAPAAQSPQAPEPRVVKASPGVSVNSVPDPDPPKPVSVVRAGATEVVRAGATETVADESSVTVTGCLENQSGAFRLKDTSGVDAPKERGWRTGFLKKRPARIELLDPGNRFELADYVGQRVAATGVLSDREMRPRSLHRVATSCN